MVHSGSQLSRKVCLGLLPLLRWFSEEVQRVALYCRLLERDKITHLPDE